jgi:glycosyltransferase involved in cell wall biosynthesis
LYVGRLTPHKGVDVLIRALPPGSALTIAGTEGHDRAEPERSYPDLLHSLAEHRNVSFMGPAEETGLPGLHRRSRVFVLPSVNRTCYGRWVAIPELLGLGILEAMASGTPVVASRVGGVPEIVADGETGYLVEPGNVEELRDRISELLNDPRRARLMGEAGRDLVLARFTWDHCARRCLEAYGAPS